jgi:uncharacterized protein YheU (UPF0270 family)
MMVVPYEKLSSDALSGVLEEYASREGTEYGSQDISMDSKVAQLKAQLMQGKALIVFDEESGTCNLMLKREFDKIVS